MTDTATADRQFRAICKTCGKKYDWRDSFDRAGTDRDAHLETCWTVTTARDVEAAREPNIGFESREVEA